MTIIVYSTPTCPYCHMVKQFLDEKGVEYEDVDVSVDSARAQEMIEKSGQMGVPVTDIDGKIIVGFNQAEIEAALGEGGGAKPAAPEEEAAGEESKEAPEEVPEKKAGGEGEEESEGVVESGSEQIESESSESQPGEGIE